MMQEPLVVHHAMTRPHPHRNQYRLEGSHRIIDLTLREPRQLFNNLDPAPFHEKDLESNAEQYIIDSLEDLGAATPTRIVVHLPPAQFDTADARSIPAAIAHYFDYRARRSSRELAALLRTGLISLVIGLLFLAACLGARSLLRLAGNAHELIAEGLLIMGWVAMWRPIDLFLYDWWPIRRQQRRFQRAATMAVEVRATTGAA
jgi:hypothetical protein